MRLFNLLKNIILAINNAKNQIKNIKNQYYHISASGVSGTYATTFTVCSLKSLPVGVYLVLGQVAGSVSNTTTIVNATMSAGTNSEILLYGYGRGTLNAGGGVHTWGLLEVTKNGGGVNLTTYRYVSSAITYGGRLAAIKLI